MIDRVDLPGQQELFERANELAYLSERGLWEPEESAFEPDPIMTEWEEKEAAGAFDDDKDGDGAHDVPRRR